MTATNTSQDISVSDIAYAIHDWLSGKAYIGGVIQC